MKTHTLEVDSEHGSLKSKTQTEQLTQKWQNKTEHVEEWPVSVTELGLGRNMI